MPESVATSIAGPVAGLPRPQSKDRSCELTAPIYLLLGGGIGVGVIVSACGLYFCSMADRI
jgi:hypothetical protein